MKLKLFKGVLVPVGKADENKWHVPCAEHLCSFFYAETYDSELGRLDRRIRLGVVGLIFTYFSASGTSGETVVCATRRYACCWRWTYSMSLPESSVNISMRPFVRYNFSFDLEETEVVDR